MSAGTWVARMVCRLIPAVSTVRGADRVRWRQTARLEDLGDLTAAWLEGHIASQPGYYGSVDVDEVEAPGLTAALVALNRAGFVTRASQAGCDEEKWRQHAAVEGYASEETVELLRRRLHGSGYEILAQPVRARFAPAGEGVPVTRFQGEPFTWFGRALSASEIAFYLDGAGSSAVKDAQRALQVTIWDPTVGRNSLWAALDQAFGDADQRHRPERGRWAMNHNGFRAEQQTAEHEAAHAVVGTLSGCVVGRVSIEPSRARGAAMDGFAEVFPPEGSWPVPLSKTAEIDVSAAGLAWELLTIQETMRRTPDWARVRQAWACSGGDREDHFLLSFLVAVVRVQRILKRPDVANAVWQTADALQASESGEMRGSTVANIVRLHVPAATMPEAANGNGLTATAGLTADSER